MSLVKTRETVQTDFSAGFHDGVAPHLIPSNGVADLQNYLLDDDGSIYGRGGNEVVSTSDSGAAIRFLWTGDLGPGFRVVFADSNDFFCLGSTDAPVNLGGAGLSAPHKAVEAGGLLLIGDGTLYGGSRKAADYTGTNNVAVTLGSTTVTKASGGFAANVDAGMLIQFDAANRYYVVDSVTSDTVLVLRDAYEGATDGTISIVASRLGTTAAAPYRTSHFYGHNGSRAVSVEGDKVYLAGFTTDNNANPHSWDSTDYHELPKGVQGTGTIDVRDLQLVFTTRGLFTISGIENDLTDAAGNFQQRLDHVAPDLILWGNEGIATWQNTAVVPCVDGVWLVDGVSSPSRISDRIRARIREYVRRGYKPGLAAVFNGHYHLPILDTANDTVDYLICRLDRGFAWSRATGTAATVSCLSAGIITTSGHDLEGPILYAAQNDAAARIVDNANFFVPDQTDGQDWDNTNFVKQWISRDYGTGGLQKNLVKRGRIRYELVGLGATMALSYSTGARLPGLAEWGISDWGQADWSTSGASYTSVTATGPVDPEGDDPFTFIIGARCRYLRLKSIVALAATHLSIRTLELQVRPTGRDR